MSFIDFCSHENMPPVTFDAATDIEKLQGFKSLQFLLDARSLAAGSGNN